MLRSDKYFKYLWICGIIALLIGFYYQGAGGLKGRVEANESRIGTDSSYEAEQWLRNWIERAGQGRLYLYAVKLFNAPIDYKAEITDAFDGQYFGTLMFIFSGDNTLTIETFPPESSRITLSVPKGFPDEREACLMLEQYLKEIGLDIDWSKPARRVNGVEQTVSFGPLDQEFNAGAFQIYESGKLVKIGYYLAL